MKSLSKEELFSSLRVGTVRNPAVRDKVLRKNVFDGAFPKNNRFSDLELFVRFFILNLGYHDSENYPWFVHDPHFISQWNSMLVVV